MVQVFYTEESKEAIKEKSIEKLLRGGTSVSVADAKQAMIEGMQQGYNKGMLGTEDSGSDNEKPEMASGIGCGLKASGSGGPLQLTEFGQPGPSQVTTPGAKQLTRKQKKEAALKEKQAAKEAAKEARKKAAEEAEEKAAADAAKNAKMAAEYPPDISKTCGLDALIGTSKSK